MTVRHRDEDEQAPAHLVLAIRENGDLLLAGVLGDPMLRWWPAEHCLPVGVYFDTHEPWSADFRVPPANP